METGAATSLTRVCVLVWTCNDVATWNSNKNGKKKAKVLTPLMRDNARILRDKLRRYQIGIVVGPGSAAQWQLEE